MLYTKTDYKPSLIQDVRCLDEDLTYLLININLPRVWSRAEILPPHHLKIQLEICFYSRIDGVRETAMDAAVP